MSKSKSPKKIRLDELLVLRRLAENRSKARALILTGEVRVDGVVHSKAGASVRSDAELTGPWDSPKYVSRGGIKLAGALDHFEIDPTGLSCLDVGASTGGFTDCLLQRGAEEVLALDVGKRQLDDRLRTDRRVTSRESFHVKELNPQLLKEPVDLAVVDVSFISLRKVLPFVIPCIRPEGKLLALIKPQFEGTPKDVPKGVVRDEEKRQEIVNAVVRWMLEELPLAEVHTVDCTIKGPKGNREVFASAILRQP